MHRNIWIKICTCIFQILISVVLTVFVMSNYFIKPIVVIDLQEIQNYQRSVIVNMKDEEKIDYIANYFKNLAENIKKRKEIVIVKQAILNPEQLKDITDELKIIKK